MLFSNFVYFLPNDFLLKNARIFLSYFDFINNKNSFFILCLPNLTFLLRACVQGVVKNI